MAAAGNDGYSGVIFLYHQITKHVILQWTGPDVDEKIKSNTEGALLSLFQDGNVSLNPENQPGENDGCHKAVFCDDTDIPTNRAEISKKSNETDLIPPDSEFDRLAHSAISYIADMSGEANEESKTVKANHNNYLHIEEIIDQPILNPAEWTNITGAEELALSSEISSRLGPVTTQQPNSNQEAQVEIKVEPGNVCSTASINNQVMKSRWSSHRVYSPHRASSRRKDTTSKSFICNVCGKSFTQRGSLNRHGLIHIGIRPYGCAQCGRTFTQKVSLVTHQFTHSDDKPYHCTICNRKYTQRASLNAHMSTHTASSTAGTQLSLPTPSIETHLEEDRTLAM